MKTTTLSKLNKKQRFRFAGKDKIYIFDIGNMVKGFNYSSANTNNTYYFTKTDKKVEIDFDN